MADRCECIVPGCRRTKAYQPDIVLVDGIELDLGKEWVCVAHWREVPQKWRRLHSLAKRKLRSLQTLKLARQGAAVWRRCGREAIERGIGIR